MTKETRVLVQRLLRKGWPNRRIVAETGVTTINVSYYRKAMRLPACQLGRPRKAKPDHYDEVVALRNSGLTFGQVGERFGFSRQRAAKIWRAKVK